MSASEANLYTDRQHLATKAYGDSGNLQARADIYAYQEPRVDLQSWVLGHVQWRGDERVLDVGCGPGSYLRRLADKPGLDLLACDISHGMLVDLARAWPVDVPLPRRAVADVQAIPLPDASQDVVLATHMLYHVPDIARAADELRRVVRPDGILLVVTNSVEHTVELFDLYADVVQSLASDTPRPPKASHRFASENGADILGLAFADITRHDQNSQLLIPSAEPVLRYLESTRATRESTLPIGVSWDNVIAEAERIVHTTIESEGVFRIRTAVSLFECR